jgi:hypothetical protein
MPDQQQAAKRVTKQEHQSYERYEHYRRFGRAPLETLYPESVLRLSTATVFSPPPERDPSPLQAAVMERCIGLFQPPRPPSVGLPELPFSISAAP